MSRSMAFLGLVLFSLGVAAGCAPAPSPAPPNTCDVSVVGDSLSVGAQPYFSAEASRVGCTLSWYDARVSRPSKEGVGLIEARSGAGTLSSVLIVGLGTNDRYDLKNFGSYVDRVIAAANGRKVIWVNTAYQPVDATVFAVLADRESRFANFRVMEWRSTYLSNPAYRARDGIHATAEGYRVRAAMMADSAAAFVTGAPNPYPQQPVK